LAQFLPIIIHDQIDNDNPSSRVSLKSHQMAVDRTYVNNVFNVVLQILCVLAGAALITNAVLRLGGWAENPYLWTEEFDIISAVICVYLWYV